MIDVISDPRRWTTADTIPGRSNERTPISKVRQDCMFLCGGLSSQSGRKNGFLRPPVMQEPTYGLFRYLFLTL